MLTRSLAIVVLLVTGFAALAAIRDKTIVVAANSAVVKSAFISRENGGAIHAHICAYANAADGGIAEEGCDGFIVPDGPVKDALVQFLDNGALKLWRTKRGLE